MHRFRNFFDNDLDLTHLLVRYVPDLEAQVVQNDVTLKIKDKELESLTAQLQVRVFCFSPPCSHEIHLLNPKAENSQPIRVFLLQMQTWQFL